MAQGASPCSTSAAAAGDCPDLEHVECCSQTEMWGGMTEIQRNSLFGLLKHQQGMI